MEIYVMSGHFGVLMEKPLISTNLDELRQTMFKWYNESLAGYLASGKTVDLDMSFLNEHSAYIAVCDDWEERMISVHNLD